MQNCRNAVSDSRTDIDRIPYTVAADKQNDTTTLQNDISKSKDKRLISINKKAPETAYSLSEKGDQLTVVSSADYINGRCTYSS